MTARFEDGQVSLKSANAAVEKAQAEVHRLRIAVETSNAHLASAAREAKKSNERLDDALARERSQAELVTELRSTIASLQATQSKASQRAEKQ
jgi:hypothetical protein